MNLQGTLCARYNSDWQRIFAVTINKLWQARNKFIFENEYPTADEVYYSVWRMVQDINVALGPTKKSMEHPLSPLSISICRHPPEEGWVKINTDGAYTHSSSTAACECVVRDHCGRFLLGFSANLRSSLVIMAELHGIFHGLTIGISPALGELLWNQIPS